MHGIPGGGGGMPGVGGYGHGGYGGHGGGHGFNYGSIDPNRNSRIEQNPSPRQTGMADSSGSGSARSDEAGMSIDKMQVQVRHGFIRKVFGIISVQLIVTAAIVKTSILENFLSP